MSQEPTVDPPEPEHAAALRDGARVVVSAGSADREEIAALVVVLDALQADRAVPRRPPAPAWQRAARLEGIGGGPVASPADLR